MYMVVIVPQPNFVLAWLGLEGEGFQIIDGLSTIPNSRKKSP